MLEIIILLKLSRSLYAKAEEKGHPGWIFALSMVLSWFFIGIGFGVVALIFSDDGSEEFSFSFVLAYYFGALLACVGNYLFVASLPVKDDSQRANDIDDEREYIERRRRGETARRAKTEEVPVDLVPLQTTTVAPPMAKRAWQRKYDY